MTNGGSFKSLYNKVELGDAMVCMNRRIKLRQLKANTTFCSSSRDYSRLLLKVLVMPQVGEL